MTGTMEIRRKGSEQTQSAPQGGQRQLLVVAEGLHVLNRQVCAAVREQNGAELVALARRHLAGGARALAVNLGPGRAMTELLPWVTETLCREIPVPLFLSANCLAWPELLQRHCRQLTINAVTADPLSLPRALCTARESGTGLVVLLVRPGLTPAGSADRLTLAAEVIDLALHHGFPLHRLYLDPVLALRPDPLAWRISRGMPDLAPVAETIEQLAQLDEVHTIVALGNCDRGGNGRADHQALVLEVLLAAGLDTVILNGLDHPLLQTCRRLAAEGLPAERVSQAA